jgi:hypothetical protein
MTTTSKRTIAVAEQGTCDKCGEPRTNSCTDAIETDNGWEQSAQRNGCDRHPVEPRVLFLDGRVFTYKEFIADANAKTDS